MEILINELSLAGQYDDARTFAENYIPQLVEILIEVKSNGDTLSKKYDLYQSYVTPTITLHEILVGNTSRQFDEIRKFKSLLAPLIQDNPFWEESRRHSTDDDYFFSNTRITDSSLAESCERQRAVLSFHTNSFISLSLAISKNGALISVCNVCSLDGYFALLRSTGRLLRFSLRDPFLFRTTNRRYQGQRIYKEINTGRFWYLDALHRDHYEVFDSNRRHLGTANLDGEINFNTAVNGREFY